MQICHNGRVSTSGRTHLSAGGAVAKSLPQGAARCAERARWTAGRRCRCRSRWERTQRAMAPPAAAQEAKNPTRPRTALQACPAGESPRLLSSAACGSTCAQKLSARCIGPLTLAGKRIADRCSATGAQTIGNSDLQDGSLPVFAPSAVWLSTLHCNVYVHTLQLLMD